ncbi:MAG TPA: glycosyltransferase family 4 protein [Vicinamibacterales bacterium]
MSVWHILTSEYPPDVGGVSDYTRQVAEGLAREGDEVHVWCPHRADDEARSGVHVHPELGAIGYADLKRLDRSLREFAAPRRLLVQWVPHGFGYHSMNVWFCVWLAQRAWHGDHVELMVHEPYLEFRGPLRHKVMACVHRLMTMVLLAASRRVWMSIPAWEGRLRPYALGRSVPMDWLPVPGCVASADTNGARTLRCRYAADDQCLVGHFGSYGEAVSGLLEERASVILARDRRAVLLLIGAGSDRFRRSLVDRHPELASRIHATAYVEPDALGNHIAACDLFVQPYPDGISSRRTSAMACLSHGQAVVTTRGHLTETLWPHDAVALVDVNDVEGFVAAAQQLIDDEPARRRLGAHALRLYGDTFALSHVVAMLKAA